MPKRIVVLMSTYNGEKYLKTQIDSILNQRNVDVELWVRDDGSHDKTADILEEYSKKHELVYFRGENRKPARSFMELVKMAPKADFYAFADQDDYWLPDKLSRAVDCLMTLDQTKPLLYYGFVTLVDKKLNILKNHSINYCIFSRIEQAVISSNATGCTMVFNEKLKREISLFTPNYQIMHDEWIHKVCLSIGGELFYDSKSFIYYRQHENNAIGANSNIYKVWKNRIIRVLKSDRKRSRGIQELLNGYKDKMPIHNREICEMISDYTWNKKHKYQLLLSRSIKTGNIRTDIMYKLAVLLNQF